MTVINGNIWSLELIAPLRQTGPMGIYLLSSIFFHLIVFPSNRQPKNVYLPGSLYLKALVYTYHSPSKKQ